MPHAQNILAQLREAEEDDDLPDDLQERSGDRADELQEEIEDDEETNPSRCERCGAWESPLFDHRGRSLCGICLKKARSEER